MRCLPLDAVGSISGAFDWVGVLLEERVAVSTAVGVVVGEPDPPAAVAVGVLLFIPRGLWVGVGEVVGTPDGVCVGCKAAF